jgi:hypothetical protein
MEETTGVRGERPVGISLRFAFLFSVYFRCSEEVSNLLILAVAPPGMGLGKDGHTPVS